MLDNGAFELGKSIATDQLIEVAKEIKADEVVAPDYPMRGLESYNMAKDFCSIAPYKMKIVVLPHGENAAEYYYFYTKVVELERANVIGFSVLFHKNYKQLRPHVVNLLIKKKVFDTSKEHHLFGLDSLAELWLYDSKYIRSVDTSLPISMAHSRGNFSICDNPAEHERVKEDAILDSYQLWHAEQFINRYLSVAHEV